MFAPTAYLRWASRYYGQVEFDLASSGMTPVRAADLGALPAVERAGSSATLRARIAAYNGVHSSEVLPTLGTTHALWTAYASLLGPGDEALVESPTYEPMLRIAEGIGAHVARFERPAGELYRLDPDRVARAITPRTRVIAVTNLHNPGGVRAPDDALRAVALIAERHGAHLLVDEVYSPFDAMCEANGCWSGSARRLAPNIIVASSLTKVYGLGAHRLGWLLAPADVIARGEDALTSNFGHAPASWAALGDLAFEHLPALANRARHLAAGKRERVDAWVAERANLMWSAPCEGLFGFAIDVRGEDLTGTIERGARESGVIVAPGSFFGVPNGFRLSWSIDATKLEEGLDRLGKVLP